MLDDILNPDLRRLEIPCRPWGVPATLVLVYGRGLLGALWLPPWGGIYEALVGKA